MTDTKHPMLSVPLGSLGSLERMGELGVKVERRDRKIEVRLSFKNE
jgi:hypothetical protein